MLGILGGTFDPIHFGHLRPAEEIYSALELNELRFVPSYTPPHRDKPHASALQRLAMVRAAIVGHDGFIADDREIKRAGTSYMSDTLDSYRQQFANMPLGLILGMDAFAGLTQWYNWRHILNVTHLIVTHRPGWGIEQLQVNETLMSMIMQRQVATADDLQNNIGGGIYFQAVTQLDISATQIRALCRQGERPNYLLPDAVIDIINQQGIYN